jgi:hypothetical protein
MERRVGLVAALCYLMIVVVMWAPHTLYSGLPYETGFPYTSDTSSPLMGFFFGDPLRIHTNFFYQVSYLLGEASGVGGSYVPYQVVHALLWWGRGLLVFMLIRRFLPQHTILAYVAGGMVLVHASDGALQFAGQINQFGFIFWMLLACYASVRAVDALRFGAGVGWAVSAILFAHMSLWSYESQLPLMLLWPALLVWLRGGGLRRRAVAIAICWYLLTALYIGFSVTRYTAAAAADLYQSAVMRHDWDLGSLASDWWFNIAESISFWRWRRLVASDIDLLLAALDTVVFLGGAAILFRMTAFSPDRQRASLRTLAAVCGVGGLALVLSFPV